MAQIYVRNALNPYKVIKVGVSFKQIVDASGINDLIWVMELGTPALTTSKTAVPPYYVYNLDLKNINDEMRKGVEHISNRVDWGALELDLNPPFVDSIYPTTYDINITEDLEIIIKDRLPSSGIDIDSINVSVNGIDVTQELHVYGTPFEYKLNWAPKQRIFDTYL